MQKIESLEAALKKALPDLNAAPQNLRLWVEDGNACSRATDTFGLTFYFHLNVLLMNFTGDIGALAVGLFAWLRTNQPDLLDPASKGFNFDVDFLDGKKVDLLIQLELTQDVSALPDGKGGFGVAYLAEQEPLMDDDLPFGGGPDFLPLFPVLICNEGELEPDGSIIPLEDITGD